MSSVLRACHRHGSHEGGFTLVEMMIMTVLLSLIAAGVAVTMMVVNRSMQSTSQQDALSLGIDSDLATIRQLSRRYTCCTGTCSLTPPPSSSFGDNQPCAVNDPDSPRYFFPQMDDPGTQLVEPDMVTSICSAENNNAFLAPLKTGIDALAVLPGVRRTTTIETSRVLRVTYQSTLDNRKLRVALLVPPMAAWCP